MCQLRKETYTCGHPVAQSTWEPEDVEKCEYAVATGKIDVNGNLQRCSGADYSTATFNTQGHCGKRDCLVKVYKKLGWKCHECQHPNPGGDDDVCQGCEVHKVCNSCDPGWD